MLRSYLVSTLLLAFVLACVPVSGQSRDDEKTAKRAARMKADVAKAGTGPNARINVRLLDGSKISGYIREIKQDSFVVVSDQSGAATEIEYRDATKFDRYRSGISRTQQALIAIGVTIGVIALVCAVSGGCRN
jgi:hypothetical protein